MALVEGTADDGKAVVATDRLAVVGKARTEVVKLVDPHPLEEPGKDPLLRLPVGVASQLHQYEDGSEAQDARQHTACAEDIADKLDERVASCQRSVEVESVDFHLVLTLYNI